MTNPPYIYKNIMSRFPNKERAFYETSELDLEVE